MSALQFAAMSSTENPRPQPSGAPLRVEPCTPPKEHVIVNAAENQLSALTRFNILPNQKNFQRVYTAAELVDHATVLAALNEITTRAVDEFKVKNPEESLLLTESLGFVAFVGKESYILRKKDLLKLALAEKTVAHQVAAHTNLHAPIVPFVTFDLTDNDVPFSSSAIQDEGPRPEVALAAKYAETKQIKHIAFRDFPSEVRRLIYPMCGNLTLRHDGQAPPLVLALARDEILGQEVRELYKEKNYSVNLKNEKEFQKKPLKAFLLSIENLYMQWGNPDPDADFKNLSLRSHKIKLMNNIRSLTMDFSLEMYSASHIDVAQELAAASLAGIERLAVRLPPVVDPATGEQSRDNADIRQDLLTKVAQLAKVRGKLLSVGPADQPEEWLWQKEYGATLDTSPFVRKVYKASALGRKNLGEQLMSRSAMMITD